MVRVLSPGIGLDGKARVGRMEVWPVIHSERKALASDLRSLEDAQWSTTSLCSEWTVRDVLAHMTATAKMSPPAFFGKLAGSGFSFNKVQAQGIAANKCYKPKLPSPELRWVNDVNCDQEANNEQQWVVEGAFGLENASPRMLAD